MDFTSWSRLAVENYNEYPRNAGVQDAVSPGVEAAQSTLQVGRQALLPAWHTAPHLPVYESVGERANIPNVPDECHGCPRFPYGQPSFPVYPHLRPGLFQTMCPLLPHGKHPTDAFPLFKLRGLWLLSQLQQDGTEQGHPSGYLGLYR